MAKRKLNKKETKQKPLFIKGKWKGKEVVFRSDRIIVRLKGGDEPVDNIIHLLGEKEKPVKKEFDVDKVHALCNKVARTIPGAKVVRYPKNHYRFLLSVPAKWGVEKLCKKIATHKDVLDAIPDFMMTLNIVTPNDPIYLGTVTISDNSVPPVILFSGRGHWSYIKIGMENAWEATKGTNNVLIGIVDTGISMTTKEPGGQLNHPDLNNVNRYILGTNFIDDGKLPRDDQSHGTHVTGTCASTTNNAQFTSGLNWVSKVYVIKALGRQIQIKGEAPGVTATTTSGAVADIGDAIREITDYALANNLKAVINLSLGGPASLIDDATLIEDYQYATDNGMLICAATGNDSKNNVNPPAVVNVGFPANLANQLPGLIAVGSVNPDDNISDFSNTGAEVTVTAPGEFIISTQPTYVCTNATAVDNNNEATSKQTTAVNFGSKNGTSMATPHVTGLASLIWSHVPQLTNLQVKNVIKYTALYLGAPDASGRNNQFGFGRIDARAALEKAGWDITLEPTILSFQNMLVGVPHIENIRVEVRSFHETSFTVTVPPTAPFSLPNGNTYILPESDSFDVREIIIPVSFLSNQPYNDNPVAVELPQSITIVCNNTNESYDISLTGNTAESNIVLVLDKSGSMGNPSGITGFTRMEVLKESAKVLLEVERRNVKIGVVAFDQDAANPPLLQLTGPIDLPEINNVNRQNIVSAIDGIAPGGSTSIGDGIESGAQMLNSVADEARKAMIVFTDGKENTAKFLSEVSDYINDRTFAVAVGTESNISIEALNTIVSQTGGQFLQTGALDNNYRFQLSKYFLHVHNGLTNTQTITDPDFIIHPGKTNKHTFFVGDSDHNIRVAFLHEKKQQLNLTLYTPDGKKVKPDNKNIIFYQGVYISYFLIESTKDMAATGKWRAEVSLTKSLFEDSIKHLKENKLLYNRVVREGQRYSFLVSANSRLEIKFDLHQNHYKPECKFILSGNILDSGIVLNQSDKAMNVKLEITLPTKVKQTLSLKQSKGKHFEDIFSFSKPGIYAFRVIADGYSLKGTRFTREQIFTGVIKSQ